MIKYLCMDHKIEEKNKVQWDKVGRKKKNDFREKLSGQEIYHERRG